MTDKELKKLSRLELLELLLTESRENERLREEIEKLKQENTILKSAERLNETSENLGAISHKLGLALEQVSAMMNDAGEWARYPAEKKTELAVIEAEVQELINEIQEEDEIPESEELVEEESAEEFVEETEETEEAEEIDMLFEEIDKDNRQEDISKRLDIALKMISSRIDELDRIANLIDSEKDDLDYYGEE